MSTKIIQLNRTDDEGPLYLCTSHIVSFIPHNNGSKVFDTSCDDPEWRVTETPEEILALIIPGSGPGGGGGGGWG